MANLEELAETVRREGYSEVNAEARVCQDIVLKAISQSSLNRNITIKGGVVMRSITGNTRRATQDMDLDFIRYPLSDDSIHEFFRKLNCLDGISIKIVGDIEELSHQEYNGKRIHIIIEDNTGHSFMSKIDLGVHRQININQDKYCFDVCMDDEGACLLINSREQIFTEKLRSVLRFGPLSTRYKDIFDLCFLSEFVDKERLKQCMDTYVFNDADMKEKSFSDVVKRIERTFSNKQYIKNVERSKKTNWLDISTAEAFEKILRFLKSY